MTTTTTTTPYGVIVTETEDYISFRLPSWLTVDERARIKSALDEWWATVKSSARREGATPEGLACPFTWCLEASTGQEHGEHHQSRNVDEWTPHALGADGPIQVYVEGWTTEEGEENEPPLIYAGDTSPGLLGGVGLPAPEARRLARALLAACDLAEGVRAPEAASTAIVAFVHDEAARQGIELSIPDPPTVDELAAAADALGMLPSDIARKAEDARMG